MTTLKIGAVLADISVDVSALSDTIIDIMCGQVLTSVESVFAGLSTPSASDKL